MADETRTVLDEEWRPAFGGVAGAHGQRLLNTDDEPTDVARVKIAIQGKRALVLLLQSSQRPTSTCPTCGGPMTGHTAACAMGAVIKEVNDALASEVGSGRRGR
jgi:hypothetical protein